MKNNKLTSYILNNISLIRNCIGINELWEEMKTIEDIVIPASTTHLEVFGKYKGICKGKTIVIVGTGPTLDYYTPIPRAIHFGMNEAINRNDINFNYYVMTDYDGCDELFKKVLSSELDMIKFFCISNSKRKGIFIPDFMRNRKDVETFYSYNPWIIRRDNLYEKKQPLMYPIDISVSPLRSYGTTFHLMMQIALWMHPEKIIIVGADTFGYKHASKINCLEAEKRCDYSQFVFGWRKLKEYIDQIYPDIEIQSMNPVGLRGVFQDVYSEDYLAFLERYKEDEIL
jgi:hypothetical protein